MISTTASSSSSPKYQRGGSLKRQRPSLHRPHPHNNNNNNKNRNSTTTKSCNVVQVVWITVFVTIQAVWLVPNNLVQFDNHHLQYSSTLLSTSTSSTSGSSSTNESSSTASFHEWQQRRRDERQQEHELKRQQQHQEAKGYGEQDTTKTSSSSSSSLLWMELAVTPLLDHPIGSEPLLDGHSSAFRTQSEDEQIPNSEDDESHINPSDAKANRLNRLLDPNTGYYKTTPEEDQMDQRHDGYFKDPNAEIATWDYYPQDIPPQRVAEPILLTDDDPSYCSDEFMSTIDTSPPPLYRPSHTACDGYNGVLHIQQYDGGAASGTAFFQFTIGMLTWADQHNFLPFIHIDSDFTKPIWDPVVHTQSRHPTLATTMLAPKRRKRRPKKPSNGNEVGDDDDDDDDHNDDGNNDDDGSEDDDPTGDDPNVHTDDNKKNVVINGSRIIMRGSGGSSNNTTNSTTATTSTATSFEEAVYALRKTKQTQRQQQRQQQRRRLPTEGNGSDDTNGNEDVSNNNEQRFTMLGGMEIGWARDKTDSWYCVFPGRPVVGNIFGHNGRPRHDKNEPFDDDEVIKEISTTSTNSKLLQPREYTVSGTGVWEHYFMPPVENGFVPGDKSCENKPFVRFNEDHIVPGIHANAPWAPRAWRTAEAPYIVQRRVSWNDWFEPQRQHAADIVRRYIRFNPYIERRAKCSFPNPDFSLGLHIRHGDKYLERQVIKVKTFYLYARAFVQNGGGAIYVATDSAKVFEKIDTKWPKEISSHVVRQPSTVGLTTNGTAAFDLGVGAHRTNVEALTDMAALSKCTFFLHGLSALSEAVLYMNPGLIDRSINLEIEDHDHMDVKYFVDHVMPQGRD